MKIAATGFFDGVHLGHRLVIGKMVEEARNRGCQSLIVTFWPHPRAVLQQDADRLRILSSLEEKKHLCYSMGVDDVAVIPFTREFSRLTARDFISEYLQETFDVTSLVIGYDHRIGCDNSESPDKVASWVSECGIEPIVVEDHRSVDGVAVSSTVIRRLIAGGDVRGGAERLGYNYTLHGVVVAGAKIGRTIGFPTANMMLYEPMKLVPANGVYVVDVLVQGQTYRGVCNIGIRPTVGDGRGQTIETHILDFDEDIYGLDIKISFIDRLRDEIRFDSLEDLKARLSLDCQAARMLLR